MVAEAQTRWPVSPLRRTTSSLCRVGEVHLPPQEVPRLVEDLLTMLGVGNVARLVPGLEKRVEPLSLRGVDRGLGGMG